MSRHAAPRSPRPRWIAPAALLVVAAVAAVAIIAATSGSSSSSAKPAASATGQAPTPSSSPTDACAKRTDLRVVAASGIAQVVRDASKSTPCVDVTVSMNDSPTAAKLLKQGKADVWIPDSRVRAVLAGNSVAAAAPSLAVSPIVIVANSAANTSRFSKTPLTWSALLNREPLGSLGVEIQNNSTSSAALVVASALNGLAQQSTGDKYLGLAATAVASTGMKSASSSQPAASTLRVEEARLVKAQPATKILPMNGGYPQLDYPWIARAGAGTPVKTAAAALLKTLQGSTGDTSRAQQGLLNPGALALEPGDYPGTRTGVLLPVPPVDSIPTLYAIADAGAAHGNTLAVLDISGSMIEPSGDGQPSKIEAVQNSGKLAAQLLSDQTNLGLWEFAFQLDPPRDYRQVVGLAPLSSNRRTLIDAVDAAKPIATGGTSLYRTTLDAYRYVQANWKADYANTVIVFTDGKDEDDPGAPSLAQVQNQLKAAADPNKPIQLIMLGYGDADIEAMKALTGTVGGLVYPINNANQIVGAFIDSISQSVLNSLSKA